MQSTLLKKSFLPKKNFTVLFQGAIFRSSSIMEPSNTPYFTRNMSTIANTTTATTAFPVTEAIRQKLSETFQPQVLEVINESHMHNVPKNSETHFKVVVVSQKFDNIKSPLQRHRLVNAALAEELSSDGPVHALSIVAKSPAQWQVDASVPASPNCQGGDGSLPKKSSSSSAES
jgi:BolA-like protein 1